MVLQVLLLLFSTLGSARSNSLPRENTRRRDSVVGLHIVKRSILPFNVTFLQDRDIYDSSVGDVIEASVESFLQTEFEEAYRFFYAFEFERLATHAELEWPEVHVKITVSFAGNFIFVLSGKIPGESELHCLQQELLLDLYVAEYEDFVGFDTGVVELDYIDFGDSVVSCTDMMDDDDAITDDHETENDKMDESTKLVAGPSGRQSKTKSISRKEFIVSREFIFLVLATVLLPMLICLGCFYRQTMKVWKTKDLKAARNKRDSSSTRKTAVMA